MRKEQTHILGYIFVVFCISCLGLMPQESWAQGKYRENVKFGKEAFSDGDYAAAAMYFEIAYAQDSTDIDLVWQIAESHRMYNDYGPALYWYRKVYTRDTKGTYKLALFWVATMYKSTGKYIHASQSFNQYIKAHGKSQDYYTRKAEREIKACLFADSLMSDTLPLKISHLKEEINTPYAEFAAFQYDEHTLEYSSMRVMDDIAPFVPRKPTYFSTVIDTTTPVAYFSKLYRSKITNKEIYTKAEEYDHEANDGSIHTANSAYSHDRKRYYFTRCTGETPVSLQCNIYKSVFQNGEWSLPKPLPDRINGQGTTNTQPNIGVCPGGKEYLYFVSDRSGGQGGLDIWYSEIKDGRTYGNPRNCGDVINTEENDITPWYDNKTGTLYFSSTWHYGLGNFDIFKSKGSADTWESPQNMGYPINTSCNDIYFTINVNDTNGYITSNRSGSFYIKGETCCNDIFAYKWLPKEEKKDTVIPEPVAVVEEKSLGEQIRELLPISLYFHNDEPDPRNMRTTTNLTYEQSYLEYIKLIPQYREEYSRDLTGDKMTKARNDIDDFFRDYVEAGYNKLVEYTRLLAEDLQNGKTVKITVKGYCSPRANSAYNMNLAKRRISSMLNYFRSFGNGEIAAYIGKKGPSGGQLFIIEEPLGKEHAPIDVSDNLNDLRNSVYSRAASMERRIVILKYDSEDERTLQTHIDEVVFKVQIASSNEPLDEAQFSGISPLTHERMPDGRYCYYAGFFNNLPDAQKAQERLRKTGYSNAFVVASHNGNRVSLSEAVTLSEKTKKTTQKDLSIKKAQVNAPDPPVRKAVADGISDISQSKGLIYSLQLCAVSSPNSVSAFKGLQPIYVERAQNGFYRYFYGKFANQQEARQASFNAREAGFSEAFPVAYYNGRRIGLQEAVKYE